MKGHFKVFTDVFVNYSSCEAGDAQTDAEGQHDILQL